MKAAPPAVRQEGPDVLLTLRVQPRASRNQLVVQGSECVLLRLTAAPVEGAANAACCAFLADRLELPRSRIAILRGRTARWKQVRIRNASWADILTRLQTRPATQSAGNPAKEEG